LIAVDATGIASYDERHCEQRLTKTSKNGVTAISQSNNTGTPAVV